MNQPSTMSVGAAENMDALVLNAGGWSDEHHLMQSVRAFSFACFLLFFY